MSKRIAIDIDGTIFVEKHKSEYDGKAYPIEGAIESVNYLYDSGYTIILHTARTYRDLEVTIGQLRDNGVKYHQLVVGKPVADVFIDDRAVTMTNWVDTLEATLERLGSPLKKVTVLVSSAGSTNGANIIKALRDQQEYQVKIIAIDSNPNAAGLYLADRYSVVPLVDDHMYPRNLSVICNRHSVDMVIPSHSAELPFYSSNRLLGVKVMVPTTASLDICNDKVLTSKFFKSSGIRHPKTYLVAGCISFPQRLFPLFLKSRFESGSTYARKVDNEEELAFYYKNTPYPVMQEYIEGVEYTVNMLSDYDGKVVGVVPIRRVRVRGGLSVEAQVELDNNIAEGCTKVVEKLGLVGPSNIQVIKRGDEIVYIEINPRFASGTLPLAVGAGFNIPLLMVKLMLGKPIGSIDIQDKVKMTRYLDSIITGGV